MTLLLSRRRLIAGAAATLFAAPAIVRAASLMPVKVVEFKHGVRAWKIKGMYICPADYLPHWHSLVERWGFELHQRACE